MNRELLEKPFATDLVKQRQGNYGKTLDYFEGHTIIQRLNEAFEAEWSFKIISHEILKEADEVLVLGELKAFDIVKSQFGSSRIKRVKETGEIISIADDLKSAATDALKKTATLLGIGLQLYNSRRNDAKQPKVRQGSVKANFNRVEGHANVFKPRFDAKENNHLARDNRNRNGSRPRQLSSKQFGYIQSLGRKNYGYALSDLSAKAFKIYGVELAGLTSSDASSFISLLHSGEIRTASM